MNVTEDGWRLVPDFSARLQRAMDYSGLSAVEVAARLGDLGIQTQKQQIHRLVKGHPDRPTNPTLVMIAGLARVCEVPVEWFFGEDGALDRMWQDYADRHTT